MRYNKKIIREITEELQKVPNVRHVCKKMGIDHSTYYRWINKHFEFHKAVEDALFIGRKNMNDAAEGVIVSKIQQGDFKAATYWLAHNNERYVSERRVKYFQYLEHWTLEFLKQEIPSDSQFEKFFSHYYVMEELLGPVRAREHMELILNVACRNDSSLKEVFYAAYAEWRNDKKDLNANIAAFDKAFPAGLPEL